MFIRVFRLPCMRSLAPFTNPTSHATLTVRYVFVFLWLRECNFTNCTYTLWKINASQEHHQLTFPLLSARVEVVV